MMTRKICGLVAAAGLFAMLAGCGTRSISDSGYREHGWHSPENPYYQGELNELDALGIRESDTVVEADIQAALNDAAAVQLRRGDAILLIQSGAMFPDDAMLTAMQADFTVTPLSGIPNRPAKSAQASSAPATENAPLNLVLRLAAARSGATALIVYWGVLESAQENQVTKTVSWTPIIGALIPDEVQRMRIRLKGVVMDVRSGKWVMLTPPAIDNARLSARIERETADQRQVSLLKEQAYEGFVTLLRQRFGL